MKPATLKISLAIILLSTGLTSRVHAGDWNQFRGPNGSGISDEKKLPTKWSTTENVQWKVALPGDGNSSPIVVGKQVLVTYATEKGKHRTLACFDRSNGKELWQQTVTYEKDDPTHATNPYCGSTPASDGERVVVYEGSAGVHCYNLRGEKLWARDLGECRHIWGYGSSPIIYRDKVIVNFGPGVKQALVALDAKTGEIVWQAPEAGGQSGLDDGGGKGWFGSWSTPLLTQADGQDQILVGYPQHVQAYDPKNGKVVWEVKGLGPLVYTDTLASGGYAVTMGGYQGPAMGYKVGGSGDMTEKSRLWLHAKSNPQRIGSGVLANQHVFICNENGTMQCIDVVSGEEKWRDRVSPSRTWCSSLLAEGRIYVTNSNSTTYIIAANTEKLQLIAENTLAEPTNATPALSDGQIFHRTSKHLWCISQ